MHQLHTTAQGERMFVSQMSDSHLHNTVKLLCERVAAAIQSASGEAQLTPAQAAIYGIDVKQIRRRQKANLRPMLDALYPYVAEAALRGAEWLSPLLQETMGRTGPESPFSIVGATSRGLLPGLSHSSLSSDPAAFLFPESEDEDEDEDYS